MSSSPHDPQGEEPVDPLPGIIAELDQALKFAPQIAKMAWALYSSFREEGFSAKQAIYLTACNIRAPEAPGDDD